MGTMTVSEACYVVFDVLAPALLAKREGHVRKPVSALKGYDLVEIDLALKLVVANEFLLLTGRNDFEKKFAEGVKAYTVPVAGLLLFVADDQVDDYDAKHAFDTYGDPRFLSQETTSSFAEYCRSVGSEAPDYWQKVYSRLDLEYTSTSPRGNDTQPPEPSLDDSGIRDHFQSIVSAFCDVISANPPHIGDCSILPYQKKTILYAIRWLMDHWECRREAQTDQVFIDMCDRLLSGLAWSLTHLVDNWHQIEPADKDAITQLNKCDSFPDWALSLKAKYIDEDAARNEALDITIEVMEDAVACEKRHRVTGQEEHSDDVAEKHGRLHDVNPISGVAKRALKNMKTPEFQSQFKQHVIEENKGITHADFVVGMQNRVIGFRCRCEPFRLVRGIRKAIFNLLVLLYQIGPLILVPLWARHEGNWWLLIGIVVSWMGAGRAASSTAVVLKGKTIGGFLGLVCIASWITLGIHNWFTFFCLCALWGCLLFQMAEEAQHEYAMQSLLESPELFHRAMAQGMIMVSSRWHKPPYEDWQEGEADKAVADCTNAIRLGLRWPSMYLDRGRAHAAKGEYDEAIADYTEAIRLDPKDSAAHEWRGMAYKAKGEDKKAALDIDECKRLMHEAGARLQQGG